MLRRKWVEDCLLFTVVLLVISLMLLTMHLLFGLDNYLFCEMHCVLMCRKGTRLHAFHNRKNETLK